MIYTPYFIETGASHCDRVNPIYSGIVFVFMET